MYRNRFFVSHPEQTMVHAVQYLQAVLAQEEDRTKTVSRMPRRIGTTHH